MTLLSKVQETVINFLQRQSMKGNLNERQIQINIKSEILLRKGQITQTDKFGHGSYDLT